VVIATAPAAEVARVIPPSAVTTTVRMVLVLVIALLLPAWWCQRSPARTMLEGTPERSEAGLPVERPPRGRCISVTAVALLHDIVRHAEQVP